MRSKGSVSTILLISCISLISADTNTTAPLLSTTRPVSTSKVSVSTLDDISTTTARSTTSISNGTDISSPTTSQPNTSTTSQAITEDTASTSDQAITENPVSSPSGQSITEDADSFTAASSSRSQPITEDPTASSTGGQPITGGHPITEDPASSTSFTFSEVQTSTSTSAVPYGFLVGCVVLGVFLLVMVVGMLTWNVYLDSYRPPSASNSFSSTVPHSNPSNPFSASTVVPAPATNPIGAPPQNTTSPFGGFGASPPATGGFGNQVTAAEGFDGFGADSPLASPALDATVDLSDSPMAASAFPPDNTPGTSPIQCPVCLDSHERILLSGRKLMSTVCGHIFCSACLPTCIKENGRCPTCRKRLLQNNVITIHI